MIYLFHGSDTERVRAKAFAWIAAARTKEPNLAYIRLGGSEINGSSLLEAASSGGLFVERLLIVLDDPFPSGTQKDGERTRDAAPANPVLEMLDVLAKSDNAIVVIAPQLSAALLKRIEPRASKAYAFEARAKEKRGFNTALVDAVALRDGRKLWLEICRALAAGDAPEMLHGLLHWKARDLMKKRNRAWTPAEARKLSLALIALPQDSRRSGIEFSEALEKFALSL